MIYYQETFLNHSVQGDHFINQDNVNDFEQYLIKSNKNHLRFKHN